MTIIDTGTDPARTALDQLLGFLEFDQNNPALLSDAAEAAIEARNPELAMSLLDRRGAFEPASPRERNLAGVAALQLRRNDDAVRYFSALLDEGADDPSLRYNLAWALSNLGDFVQALDILDDRAANALARAATLRVQLRHQLGQHEEAYAEGKVYASRFPDDAGLAAAMSVLAIDLEDETAALLYAKIAGDQPDAMVTRGTLALGQHHATEALALFDKVLAVRPDHARASVGRGLAKLLSGEAESAAADLDRGATGFGDHLGSWIAAGWAHFVLEDTATSRARFEKALDLDPTFAESHGSLAVLDVLAGDAEQARKRAETAFRLDRNCYSAALASSLLAAGSGDAESARRIFARAAATPIDSSGRTIAQALATMGLKAG